MSEWDRKALLQLMDEAGAILGSMELTSAQRHALHRLLEQFGAKAKNISANREDVLTMQGELARILGNSTGNTT